MTDYTPEASVKLVMVEYALEASVDPCGFLLAEGIAECHYTGPQPVTPPLFRHRKQFKIQDLNLCLISADSFFIGFKRHHNHKHRYSEKFFFLMLMLDRTIENKLANEDEETRKQILDKLLK
jgi:hypothetical protein